MSTAQVTKDYSEYEQKMREYYWKCFISEFSKIIIYFVVFSLLGFTKEYLAALLFLMLFRNNGGGIHCKHYTSCLLVSFTFLCLCILLGVCVVPPQLLIYISVAVCGILGYFLVPITSSNRPSATPEQVKKSKKNTVILITLFFILTCICPLNRYLYIGYWTLILHIIQLAIARAVKEVKNNVEMGS